LEIMASESVTILTHLICALQPMPVGGLENHVALPQSNPFCTNQELSSKTNYYLNNCFIKAGTPLRFLFIIRRLLCDPSYQTVGSIRNLESRPLQNPAKPAGRIYIQRSTNNNKDICIGSNFVSSSIFGTASPNQTIFWTNCEPLAHF